MADVSYNKLKQILQNHGCYFVRQAKGSHEFWYSPITKKKFPVATTIKSDGTYRAILKQAGIKA